MSVPKQKFTAEFKYEAVRLVRTTGKSCAQIARDLSVPLTTLSDGSNNRTTRRPLAALHLLGGGSPPSHHRKLVLKNWNGSWKLHDRNGIS